MERLFQDEDDVEADMKVEVFLVLGSGFPGRRQRDEQLKGGSP